MKLLVHERLNLMGILPKEGDFLTLKILRELQQALSFTEEEHSLFNFQQEGESVKWDQPEDMEKAYPDIPVGKKAEGIIVEALEKLNNDKKLTEQFFSLYEKFCVEEEEN